MTFAVQCLGSVIGALLNYVIMKVIITSQRGILLDVQGSNVVSNNARLLTFSKPDEWSSYRIESGPVNKSRYVIRIVNSAIMFTALSIYLSPSIVTQSPGEHSGTIYMPRMDAMRYEIYLGCIIVADYFIRLFHSQFLLV